MYSRSGAAVDRLNSRTTRNGIFGAPFFARLLILVPCSLLRNRTETTACYAGYDGKRRVSLIKPSVSFPVDLFTVFVLLLFKIYLFFWSKGVFWPPILDNLPSDPKVVYADVL